MAEKENDHKKLEVQYRITAEECVARARAELKSGKDERLRYAALELRMALEALTYYRALIHRNEIPPEAYSAWQPRKVIEMLKEHMGEEVDQPYSLTIRETGGELVFTGTDRPISLKEIKDNYDALGSYLHLQSLKQAIKKPLNLANVRQRCEKVLKIVVEAMESNVTSSFGLVARQECARSNCSNVIVRRIPRSAPQVTAKCFLCNAGYTIHREGDMFRWEPWVWTYTCPHCGEVGSLWTCDIKFGKKWVCHSCSRRFDFVLSYRDLEEAGSKKDLKSTPIREKFM